MADVSGMISEVCKFRFEFEDGSWSDWKSSVEDIPRDKRFVSVEVQETVSREQFLRYLKKLGWNLRYVK